MFIDISCGSRMTWYEKNREDVIYCDMRNEEHHDYGQSIVIRPDVVCDNRMLPFPDNTFNGCYWDPPHIVRFSNSSWMAKKYSMLFNTWREDLNETFLEANRVTRPGGFICIKWSSVEIPLKELIAITGEPSFGSRTGKNNNTYWLMYLLKE